MAFLPPEQQNQDAPSGATTPNPGGVTGGPPPQAQAGGSVGAGGNAPKAGAAPNTATPNQFGSSASNLQSYLTANAPQITNQANAVAGTLNNQYGQVSGDLSNAVNQFGQEVNSGYTAGNQDLVNQAAANPAGFVSSDPNNTAAFQAQYNDAYTGPQNFESTTPYGQIQSEVSNAVQNAGTLNTQAGLQNYFAGTSPNATQASNTLDALLVNGNPQAQQTVQNAANQFQQLTPALANDTTQADTSVTAAQQAAANAAQYAQNTINPVATNFANTLNTQLNNDNANNTAYNNNLSTLQAQATPIVPLANSFLQSDPNSGFQDYFQNIPGLAAVNPATLAQTATTPQYQEDAALAQLIGQGYSPVLNQANINQAGTYQAPGTLPNFQDLLAEQVEDLGQSARNTVSSGNGGVLNNYYGTSPFDNLGTYLNSQESDYPTGDNQYYQQFVAPETASVWQPGGPTPPVQLAGGGNGAGFASGSSI